MRAVEMKHALGDFAVVTTTASTTATHYLHRDHLGTLSALPIHAAREGRATIGARDAITDDFGAVVQRLSFDASKRSLASPRRASGARATTGWP